MMCTLVHNQQVIETIKISWSNIMARKNPFSNSGKETKSRKKTRQGNGRGTKHSTRVGSKDLRKNIVDKGEHREMVLSR